MIQKKAAIILAAGRGTRMKSSLPKVLHPLAGKPIIKHVIDSCYEAGIDDLVIVIGPDMPELAKAVNPIHTAIQAQALGTGDAAKAAKDALEDYDGYIFIRNGDSPFVEAETLGRLFDIAQDTGLAVLGFETDNPFGYGRLVTDDKHHVIRNIEEKDCTPEQRKISLCNAGAYCVKGDLLFKWLDRLTNNNAQGEYYLPDIIAIAATDGVACNYALGDIAETVGVNSREQLAEAEKILQQKLRKKAMDSGVTMIDPDTVFLSTDTQFENDVTIEPNVFFGAGVRVGQGTAIHAFSHLEGVEIGRNAAVGPFARLRPHSKIGDHVTVGNFIEVNRSEFKEGSKSKHLSYIGDAVIGEKTNVGAGTVIANYDGFNKNDTRIGNGAFIGSNSTLVAPLTVGEGAIIAAGSTITRNVAENALAVGRAKQSEHTGWAEKYREGKRKQ